MNTLISLFQHFSFRREFTWEVPVQAKCLFDHHHHHHQSLFIHEIVSFYMVFLGIVFKTRLKYSKELLTTTLQIQKLTL